jgi:HD-GYP domain-containing protein (c-di-GMP phosphodiesterase class II)
VQLPVSEPLLDDKPDHVIARPVGQNPFGDNIYGFRMDVPTNQYNRGEVHNLCVSRGTLTEEERFKINEHVIQTIRMLGQLPFPRELRRVPDWAGNHHEKLDGTGYPRRLSAADLSIPERIMAIADIFEALTARDRPYSAPRTMSKALGIMGSMCSQGHLCADLFELFLTSGVYLEYGKEFLDPEQLDEVDVAALISVASG